MCYISSSLRLLLIEKVRDLQLNQCYLNFAIHILKLCYFQVDAGTITDASTLTEPENLGPCEPGTSVNLEGIVWHETDSGTGPGQPVRASSAREQNGTVHSVLKYFQLSRKFTAAVSMCFLSQDCFYYVSHFLPQSAASKECKQTNSFLSVNFLDCTIVLHYFSSTI